MLRSCLCRFQECNFDVNAAFASDYARSFDQPNVVDMLNAGLKVLIYAGAPFCGSTRV